MKRSVNILKISPPDLPTLLHRPRLHNLLEKNKNKKLILILGQAAQGKTTLVASYVKTSKVPTAWINLDKTCLDPINLYNLTVQSLQYGLKKIDFSALLEIPIEIINPLRAITLFGNMADYISKNVSHPFQIVFDGLDRLFWNPLPFECLQTLIENLPVDAHLIMTSRGTPPPTFEFQHLKIRQEAFILTNEDLAFSSHEVQQFFRQIKKINLGEEESNKIWIATEGWVGGLILISESLLRSSGLRKKDILRKLPDHLDKESYQYFGKEILSSQPKEAQQFLVQSSIMDVIEPRLAQEAFGIENPEEILRDHTRKNLFVQSFYDEKKGWLYRYNLMFRNFLKAKYIADTTAEERQALNKKIGTLYQQREELEEAIRYFLEAKAYPQAISIMESKGIELLREGRKSDLLSWMNALPEDLVLKRPWLLLYRAMAKQWTTDHENVIFLQKAYQLFKENRELKGELISLGQLISTITQTGTHLFPISQLTEEAEALCRSAEGDAFPYEKGALCLSMAQADLLVEGRIRKGIQACESVYIISKQIHDLPLQTHALVFSALGYICAGEFRRAAEAYQKLEAFSEKIVWQEEIKIATLVVRCVLMISMGDFEEAHRLIKASQIEIEKYSLMSIAPWVYEITVYLKLARGEWIDAEEMGNRYLSMTRFLKNPFLKGLALRLLGLVYLHQKDFNKAKEFVDQSIHVFSHEAPSRYHLHRDKIILGLIFHEMKEGPMGEKALNEALEYFSSIPNVYSMVEIHFALAFLKWDQEKREEATFHLREGFRVAAEKKYKYFYSLGRAYITQACLLALELKVEEAIDYITQLLILHPSLTAGEGLKKLSNHSDPAIQKKVWEIRRSIYRSRVPRLRIETLGGFRVLRGDSLIEEKEWERQQPKQLLKAILSHGMAAIPKEILIENLWPDEKPGQGENNFKTALHRLRKTLEPGFLPEFGSSYIHLHHNQIILDNELCQLDINQFLSLIKKGEEMEKKGNEKESLSFYVEALGIYQGDFLKGDLYFPWVDKKREELRNQYILLLHKTANLYDRQGSFKKAIECYKKVIEVDPLLEESYQKLMMLYSAKGLYNEALRTYKACMKIMKKELRTEPDALTMAIYNKILEKSGFTLTTKKPNRNRKK
ncbi:MAG: tetratricopeptide repeat protein [Syntrophaceae bacterium]|nr:tetratricopeptide repeat protein [Syntrophaceae bacterium]